MSKKQKLLSVLGIVGVLAAGTAGMLLLTSFKAEAARQEAEIVYRDVRTETLYSAPRQARVTGNGFLQASRSLEVQVPLSGRTVYAKDGLKGGVPVEQGEVVLRLDDRRARIGYGNARLELLRLSSAFLSQMNGDPAGRDRWERYLTLLEDPAITDIPAPPAAPGRERLLAATQGVLGAWYALDEATLTLEDHALTAPFAGTLIGDGVTEGAWVAPGVPLATLADTERLELSLALTAEDLAQVAPGATVSLTRPGSDGILTGTVIRIEPQLQAGSQTARALIVTDPPVDGQAWLPGTFAEASIEGTLYDQAFRVPRRLLTGGRLPVYDDGALALLDVAILAYQGEDVLLAPTFPEGTELVTTVIQTPLAGMALRKETSGEESH